MKIKEADAEWYRTTMSRWLNNRGTTVFVGHYLTKDSLKNLEESPRREKDERGTRARQALREA